jgi:hypothetical protein
MKSMKQRNEPKSRPIVTGHLEKVSSGIFVETGDGGKNQDVNPTVRGLLEEE